MASLQPPTIHNFPTEIWSLITARLEAKTLHVLWSCGDVRILRLLLRGGVESLYFHTNGAWDDVQGWPSSMVRCFQQIKEVRISRTKGHISWQVHPRLNPSQVALLPRNLLKLDLVDYYVHWNISHNDPITAALLRNLPPTLTWLSFPAYTVSSEAIAALPPLLSYLELGRSNLNQKDLQHLPTELQHLVLRQEEGLFQTDAYTFLPRGLQSLTVLYDESNVVALDEEFIRLLPHELVHLRINADFTLPLRSLSWLPPTLETLRMRSAVVVEDHQFVSFALPHGLRNLELHTIQESLIEEAFGAFPPLATFALLDAAHISPKHIGILPRSITDLTFMHAGHLSNRAVHLLPQNLRRLTLTESTINTTGLKQLPNQLTYLDTGNSSFAWKALLKDGVMPLSLVEWKTGDQAWDIRLDRLPRFVNVYEKPTLLREFGYWISRHNASSIVMLAMRAVSIYIACKQGTRILPSVPVLVSTLLRRTTNNILGVGLGLLYFLR